jgi:hypothetical protein
LQKDAQRTNVKIDEIKMAKSQEFAPEKVNKPLIAKYWGIRVFFAKNPRIGP